MKESSVDMPEKEGDFKDKMKQSKIDNDRDKETNLGDEVDSKQKKVPIKAKSFDYLIPVEEDPVPFNIINDKENIFQYAVDYKYIICILLKDNNIENCLLLEKTIKAITDNLGELNKLEIEPNDIYIFIFANQLEEDPKYLVKKESLKLLTKEKMYLKTSLRTQTEANDIKIDFICKKRYMYDVEALKCFYYYCVDKLKKEDKNIITSVITAGVIPVKSCLKKMIQLSFAQKTKTEKNFGIVVPMLDVENHDNFFIKLAQYERTHFNLYNMNFYNSTAAVPVYSLLNTMIINKSLMLDIKKFYMIDNIFSNATIDYHDYKLGLYLYRLLYKVIYINNESLGLIKYNIFNLMEYKDNWVNKYSGYYGNFFEILKTFTFCSDFGKKVFMFFQIIGLMIEFVYPALSLMVIYSIFYEAFYLRDINLAVFMTMFYLLMNLGGGAFSMISNKSEKMDLANYFIYFFMEFYYLLILICSIVAMNNLNKKNENEESLSLLIFWFTGKENIIDEYKFNKAACGCLIVFTFLIAILPICLKFSLIMNNIVQMFIYLFLGAPSSNSNFLISKIWKAPEASGGEFPEERKGITIIAFFFYNLFIGFLTFYNYNRKLRANCVMGLSIFYLIYLFFKIIAILSSLFQGIEINDNNNDKIKRILSNQDQDNIKGSKNNLANSTEKLNKNSSYENEEKLDQDEENNNQNNNNNNENFEVEENNENKQDNENNDEENLSRKEDE